jgi:uncharacterized protein with PQ loop repeat
MISQTEYYYILFFASIITSFSFIPLIFEILQQKLTKNIPYITLILLLISYLIYLFVSIIKGYYIHIFFYLIGFVSVFFLLYLKIKYDNDDDIEISNFEENS